MRLVSEMRRKNTLTFYRGAGPKLRPLELLICLVVASCFNSKLIEASEPTIFISTELMNQDPQKSQLNLDHTSKHSSELSLGKCRLFEFCSQKLLWIINDQLEQNLARNEWRRASSQFIGSLEM